MMQTNNGRQGGTLVGDAHSAPSGGIKAVVVTDSSKPVLLEGGEAIINKEATALHKEELSQINQSAGNGVPILENGGQVPPPPVNVGFNPVAPEGGYWGNIYLEIIFGC